MFANEPVAKERDYTIGTFSFNSGNGRCPTCGGNGFEHVEMQFLSDVYLRCADCNGRRYRGEILEVKLNRGPGPGRSIADVLDMTVSEAVEFFAGEREVLATLRPLAEVGLDYLRLGQPVPTLSGGEAQRLKLAGHLAESATARSDDATPGKLFLFDEPTTGLHFDDIAKLLRAFRRLIAAGHSLLVIEHNLDVIAASDWLIDLGPEGGEAGGEVIAVGTPAEVMKVPGSHTGKALREVESGWKIADQRTRSCRWPRRPIGRRRTSSAFTALASTISRTSMSRLPRDKFHCRHRRVRLGQVDAGLRHRVRRRTAPLSRIAQRLCAPVRAAGVASRCRCDLRYPADGCHRTAHQPRRSQEHRGDADRDLSLPAPAVREAGHSVLPGLRRAHRAAEL